MRTHNTSPPDARVKVPASERAAIAKRVQAGEAVEQVAADYGVTPRQIRNIVAKEQKQQAEKAERQKTVAKLGEETLGIQHGDFRKAGKIIDDDSVDLIFTDPPYGKESVALYGDLSGFALRVLRPGGLCVAYAGQAFLPQVMASMATHLDYVWTFAKWHTEGDQRIRNFKIRNGWKPLLLFCKPPLTVWWDWLRDVSLGRKDKGTHEWQQAEGDAEYIIDHLCPKKGYVVDCFVGGGTTAVVSLRLKRRFIGFEIDAKTAKAARARLAKT